MEYCVNTTNENGVYYDLLTDARLAERVKGFVPRCLNLSNFYVW